MTLPHLNLVLRGRGRARLSGGGKPHPRTRAILDDPKSHIEYLSGTRSDLLRQWKDRRDERKAEGRPPLPAGTPLLLEIDPRADIGFLESAFAFEIVCEQEDGLVLVSAEDQDLTKLAEVIGRLSRDERGGGSAAKLHEFKTESERLKRVLSPDLYEIWPKIGPDALVTVDVSVECIGGLRPPSPIERREDEPDANWERRKRRYDEKWAELYERWDDLKRAREIEIERIIDHYEGVIFQVVDGDSAAHQLPDSFSVRCKLSGDALRDMVLNYPYLFEAALPDDIEIPIGVTPTDEEGQPLTVDPPEEDAPSVCIIDSGIQEAHPLLQPAVRAHLSHCFVPGVSASDVADYVMPGGHGTRVAGGVLFPTRVASGRLQAWILNARVLDAQCALPENVAPGPLLRRVLTQYLSVGARIYVHAINSRTAARTTHMSAWAAEIDLLAAQHDMLFIQSAGNIPPSSQAVGSPGVREHLQANREYPHYLLTASARIANPAQSLHAVTVGSLAHLAQTAGGWRTIATAADRPSAFSRSGPGLWGAVKPEIVEYGGDYAVSGTSPPLVSTPVALRQSLPELVRSTLGGGPLVDRDDCGTSFSTPKAAAVAASIAAALPSESALTYRTLLVHSARWPTWVSQLSAEEKKNVLAWMGFGVPSADRGSRSERTRVTMLASNDALRAREAHIYQLRLPPSLLTVAEEFDVLLEVTLGYYARPRRTRRSHRGYLSTWLDWKTSRLGESPEAFLKRVLVEGETASEGLPFEWTIGDRSDRGAIPDVRRNLGSVQKDWAVVRASEFTKDFCIAVVGHPGWDAHVDAAAPYSLAVTFELLNGDLDLHSEIELQLDSLRAELAAVVEVGSGDA